MDKKIKDGRTIHIKNSLHLGDTIFSFVMFYNIMDYIEKNNIFIIYYCHAVNINQLSEFNMSKNITILPLEYMPTDDTKIYDSWIASRDYEYIDPSPGSEFYDDFLCKFHNNFLKVLDIPIEIQKFVYEDPDLFNRYENINQNTNNKYRNIDILISNGAPRSNQIDYDLDKFDNIITVLSEKYNIVTTQEVDGIKCTRDDNLTAKDIAAISTNVKNIIAIDSGVVAGFYNTYTFNNVEKIYMLHRTTKWSHPKIITLTGIDELSFLLKKNPLKTSIITNVDNFADIKSIYDKKVEYYSILFYCFIILFLLSIIVSILYKNKKFMSRIYLR